MSSFLFSFTDVPKNIWPSYLKMWFGIPPPWLAQGPPTGHLKPHHCTLSHLAFV